MKVAIGEDEYIFTTNAEHPLDQGSIWWVYDIGLSPEGLQSLAVDLLGKDSDAETAE